MMEDDLKEQGHIVVTAIDGQDAIEKIEEHQPSLLLLDLLMPRKDGYDVLRHIREKNYAFPVLMLSNMSEPKAEAQCRSLGAKDFIIKSTLDYGEIGVKVQE